jgi:hypothetical protein
VRRFFRYAFLTISALFVAAIVTQVFFAGLMLFGTEGGTDLHTDVGWTLSLVGLVFLLLPALARAGRNSIILGIVLAAATFFQPVLAEAREDSPLVAAFHPVNALLIFTLSILLTRRALYLVREEREATSAATS